MSTTTGSSSGGIGFCGLLAVLFIGLKLTHVIGWSWWWVLAPLWMPLVVAVAIALTIVAAGVAVSLWRQS